MRSFIASLACLVLLSHAVYSRSRSCPGGTCSTPAPSAVQPVAAQPALAWFPAIDGTHLLYRGEVLVGQWMPNEGRYRTAVNGLLADRGEIPPIHPPATDVETPTGVAWEMIEQRDEKVSRHGRPSSKREVYEAFALPADRLTDDSKAFRLTIYAAEKDARQKLRDEVSNAPAFEPWRGDVLVWDAPADHWSLDGLGFVAGKQGVILTTHAGQVLHHQTSLDGGQLLAALRRADPKRDPKNDPDLSAPNPVFIDPASLKKYGGLALVCGAGLGLLFFRRGSSR